MKWSGAAPCQCISSGGVWITLPRGVRLTAYHGEAEDLPPSVLQQFLDDVAAGHAVVPIDRVYRFDAIAEAHAAIEAGGAAGKLVVTT